MLSMGVATCQIKHGELPPRHPTMGPVNAQGFRRRHVGHLHTARPMYTHEEQLTRVVLGNSGDVGELGRVVSQVRTA